MNSNDALLTVNVVTYNHKDYIAECLDSILSQKTNFDFVIRIFDDCSTDGTTEICREYADKFPEKIKFYPTEVNLGATENPLRAYQNIKTKYYMYIEGDDYLCDDNKFQIQVKILEKNPDCSFVCNTTTVHYPNGVIMDKYPNMPAGKYSLDKVLKFDYIFVSSIASRIARTDAITLDNEKYYLLDSAQAYMLLEKGNMLLLNRVMNVYRITGNGVWSGLSLKERFEFVFKLFMGFNEYSNGKYEKPLFRHLISDFTVPFNQKYHPHWLNSSSSHSICNEDGLLKNRLKRFKHYVLPPLIIDMLNWPRDFSRFLKSNFAKH